MSDIEEEKDDLNMQSPDSVVLPVTITTKAELYASYMPFIKSGALFILTKDDYQLDDEVFILLKLMDETEKFPVAGRVIWVTPQGAQGGMKAGIGVEFLSENATVVRNKIETLLAGRSGSDKRTDTM